MFAMLDADAILDERDDPFDDDWVRAAEALQAAWNHHPDAGRAVIAIDAVREAAFKRTFAASGHHDLSATLSDDFDFICRRALLGVEMPFITALEHAYDAHQAPH